MTMIDSFEILAAIGKVQEPEELYKGDRSYYVLRIDATCDANRILKMDDYHDANRVAQAMNHAYNEGKRAALQELAAELTKTKPIPEWLKKRPPNQ